jgi:hypothetical protein
MILENCPRAAGWAPCSDLCWADCPWVYNRRCIPYRRVYMYKYYLGHGARTVYKNCLDLHAGPNKCGGGSEQYDAYKGVRHGFIYGGGC